MARKSVNALTVAPLAIGLAHFAAVTPTTTTHAISHKKVATCAVSADDLSGCPVTGCADPKTEAAHALVNRMKRHKPTGPTTDLIFNDLLSLQTQADKLVGQDKELEKDARDKLAGMKVKAGNVSEGDSVRLVAFVVGQPKANTGESVNCNLKGQANNDFHIPVVAEAGDSDFAGIVVEMIPQNRNAGWTLPKLHALAGTDRMVRVTGQLFYDNMHRVNDDESDPQSGQPARSSLWEIHQVTAFDVCLGDTPCKISDDAGWKPLESVTVKEINSTQ
jgi:hypothetical protein